MKFLLDHDVPDEIAGVLRHIGHDVTLVRDVLTADAEDHAVFDFAQAHRLIIVTCNRDHFLMLARTALEAKPPQPFHRLVILVRRRTRHAECARVLALIHRAGEVGLAG